jgi:RNA polymerase sigma factor (sigma-70 family)
MTTTDCEAILKLNITELSNSFKNTLDELGEKFVSCFFVCYKAVFINWSVVMYKGYDKKFMQYNADNAFTDAVVKFKDAAIEGKLYEGKASLRTILFQYFRNTLRSILLNEKRQQGKQDNYGKSIGTNNNLTFIENDEILKREAMYATLENALNKMNPTDKQIIVWRHLEEKSCDEIARLLDITKEAATNRIYRCMERLRNLIEKAN